MHGDEVRNHFWVTSESLCFWLRNAGLLQVLVGTKTQQGALSGLVRRWPQQRVNQRLPRSFCLISSGSMAPAPCFLLGFAQRAQIWEKCRRAWHTLGPRGEGLWSLFLWRQYNYFNRKERLDYFFSDPYAFTSLFSFCND